MALGGWKGEQTDGQTLRGGDCFMSGCVLTLKQHPKYCNTQFNNLFNPRGNIQGGQ